MVCFVLRNLLQIGVESSVKSSLCELSLGDILQAATVEGILQMLNKISC